MNSHADEHVLIIDDEPTERVLLRQALENDGMVVKDAVTGEDGLAIFDKWHPDIVLLDVDMPGIDGFETCEAIRAHPAGHHIAIVMVTRFDDVESIRQAYASGATDFITKPINWGVLPYRVRYLLRAAKNTVALEKSQIRLASAQRMVRMGYWEYHPRHGALSVSEELCNVFNFDHQTDSFAIDDLLGIMHPEDRDTLTQELKIAEKTGCDFSIDHRVVDGNSNVRFVQHQVAVQKDPHGNVLSLIGTVQDITERKEQEEDLRRAKIDVEQANGVKTEFLNNISHEVRTPMNGILGMLTLLDETTLDSEQQDYLSTAMTSADHLLALLNDLLDFSRVDAVSAADQEQIELSGLIHELSTRYGEVARNKGLHLETRLDPHCAQINVALSPSRKILSILLDNAVKFTQRGRVSLIAEPAYNAVGTIETLRLKVHDTGIGIEASALSRIFDLFTQEDGSTTRQFGGSGVGLALCKRLVDHLQGLITVSSIKGQGSQFEVTLPLSGKSGR